MGVINYVSCYVDNSINGVVPTTATLICVPGVSKIFIALAVMDITENMTVRIRGLMHDVVIEHFSMMWRM